MRSGRDWPGRQVSAIRALVVIAAFGALYFLALTFVLQRGHVISNAFDAAIVSLLWGSTMWLLMWRPNARFRKQR